MMKLQHFSELGVSKINGMLAFQRGGFLVFGNWPLCSLGPSRVMILKKRSHHLFTETIMA